MAMSLSRPDPSSPAEIADATFSTGRRGFDQSEVRDFLGTVAAELGRLQERERYLERELRTAQANPDFDSARLDDEALARLLGEETARVISAAKESAHEIRAKAEGAASLMLSEASDEASRLREEAEIESSRRRADAAADAESEVSMAKQQGREMVNEARAYRERVLSELARRRELAREQIEQLIHGRDRLMQAFERARLVAVDVVAELEPLGEPEEYVNLAPTTGPVPVMVARGESDGSAIAVGETDHDTERAADDGTPEAEVISADGGDAGHETAAGADDREDEAVTDESEELQIRDDAETVSAAELQTRDDGETSPDDGGVGDGHADEAASEDDESADRVGSEDAGETVEHAETADGDVVVDLFARLRADAETAGDTDTAGDGDGSDGAAVERIVASSDEPGDDAGEDDVLAEDTPFGQRDADLTPLIVASAKKLKRVLADEQNEVLDALRRKDPVRNLDALLPWASEHAARYSSAIDDELLVAAQAGATLATPPDRMAKLRKAAGREVVDHAGTILDESLITPLRERLERCVADGDGDNAAITKKVRAAYRECKTQHIDEQLDDVFRAAHGRGVLAAIDPGRPVTWAVDPSHPGCPDCEDNVLAGAVAAGQPFPTGDTFAPAHAGCRCLLVAMHLSDA